MTTSTEAIQNATQTKNNPVVPAGASKAPPQILQAHSDEAALDQAFRQQVIKDITSNENEERKSDSLKRYDVYKDGTLKYVKEALQKEITDGAAALDMMNRAVDISIVRNVITKKARVYQSTVDRKIVLPTEDPNLDQTIVQRMADTLKKGFKVAVDTITGAKNPQTQLDLMEKYMRIGELMKKTNRILELHKNALIKVVPYRNDDGTWSFDPRVLHPHEYDVVEDSGNPENPRMIIISHYVRTMPANITLWTGSRPIVGPVDNDWRYGNDKEKSIAGAPADEGAQRKRTFIWWTAKYHFVTDESGAVITNPDGTTGNENPIGRLPFVPAHIDQDGSFWAIGGDDLINMAVLINVLLTDINFTMKYQGAGVLYAFGHGLPKAIQVGPNRAIIWEYQTGDPEPKVGFATSSPPIAEMLQTITEQLGFLLSSNDLEVTSISGSIAAGRTNSGVQELIQRSQVITAIEDMQATFIPVEIDLYQLAAMWTNFLLSENLADEDLKAIGKMDPEADVAVKFQAPEVFSTELEKVQTLQARKLLGINTTKQLIQMDNPDMSEAEVLQQLADLKAEKITNTPVQLQPQVDANGNIIPQIPPTNPTNPTVANPPVIAPIPGGPGGPGATVPPAKPKPPVLPNEPPKR